MTDAEFFAGLRKRFASEVSVHTARKNWDNVISHCLIEAARTEVLAQWLNLPESIQKDAAKASVLHDFFKRQEMEIIRKAISEGKSAHEAYHASSERADEELSAINMPSRIVALVSAVGGDAQTLFKIYGILADEERSEEELAMLVVQYVDNFTRGSFWVEPAANGKNDIDRRMEHNATKEDYQSINTEMKKLFTGHPFFGGKEPFEAMAELSHKIEQELCRLIALRSKKRIEPLALPETVDRAVKSSL